MLVRLSVWSEVQTCMWQLMPLPLTVSCFSKIQIGFTFLVPAHPGSPGQMTVKRVCVCVLLCCSTMQQTNHKRVLDVAFLNSCRRSLSDNNATRCVLYCTTPETTHKHSVFHGTGLLFAVIPCLEHTHTHLTALFPGLPR